MGAPVVTVARCLGRATSSGSLCPRQTTGVGGCLGGNVQASFQHGSVSLHMEHARLGVRASSAAERFHLSPPRRSLVTHFASRRTGWECHVLFTVRAGPHAEETPAVERQSSIIESTADPAARAGSRARGHAALFQPVYTLDAAGRIRAHSAQGALAERGVIRSAVRRTFFVKTSTAGSRTSERKQFRRKTYSRGRARPGGAHYFSSSSTVSTAVQDARRCSSVSSSAPSRQRAPCERQ
jgi:hypothetical protein